MSDADRDFEATRERIERVRDCEEIVYGWDDPNDFSLWKDAFERLKPPLDDSNGDSDVAPLRQD